MVGKFDPNLDPFTLKPGTKMFAKYTGSPDWPCVLFSVHHLTDKIRKSLKIKDITKIKKVPIFFLGDRSFGLVSPSHIRYAAKDDLDLRDDTAGFNEGIEEYKEYKYPDGYIQLLIDDGIIDREEQFIATKTLLEKPEGNQVSESKKKAANKRASVSAKDEAATAPAKPTNGRKKRKTSIVEAKKEDDPEILKEKAHEFRYRLQKGLVQRGTPPDESDMEACSDVMTELEKFSPKMTLELLKHSKLHKVLRAIIKIDYLDRPEDYRFHTRAEELLLQWEKLILSIKNEKVRDSPNTSVLDTPDASHIKEENGQENTTSGETEENIEAAKTSEPDGESAQPTGEVKDDAVKEQSDSDEAAKAESKGDGGSNESNGESNGDSNKSNGESKESKGEDAKEGTTS
jgi:hypothetical protein